MDNNKVVNVLIACTGSVATIKIHEIVQLFRASVQPKFEIRIITTERAKHFMGDDDFSEDIQQMYDDADEWAAWQKRGDPVLHIDLTKWADVMVVAPLGANSLAKMANVSVIENSLKLLIIKYLSQGLCDNLLLCTARAWQLNAKPILFAPAMNTFMWEHPITAAHIATLKSWSYREIPCICKTLMCGDTGMGAMASPADILRATIESLEIK